MPSTITNDGRSTTWPEPTTPEVTPTLALFAALKRIPQAVLEAEGQAQQTEANVKQAGDHVKDAAEDAKDAFKG